MGHRVTLLPGDGIGPEVVAATVRVLEATGVSFDWERFDKVGAAALDDFGTPLPEPILDSIRENKVALKGPITTPVTSRLDVQQELRKAGTLRINYSSKRDVTSL